MAYWGSKETSPCIFEAADTEEGGGAGPAAAEATTTQERCDVSIEFRVLGFRV